MIAIANNKTLKRILLGCGGAAAARSLLFSLAFFAVIASSAFSIDKSGGLNDLERKALFQCARSCYAECVESYVKAGGDPYIQETPGKTSSSLLWTAFDYGCDNVIRRLVDIGVDAASGAGSGFLRAVFDYGDKEAFSRLAAAGYDLDGADEYGLTLLGYSLVYHRRDIEEFLLQLGAKVYASKELFGEHALQHAVFNNDIELASKLLADGADPNETLDVAPASYALDRQDLYVLRRPGRNDCDSQELIPARDMCLNYGLTPLHEAAFRGRTEIARKLIDNGADVNRRSARNGITPLVSAIIGNNKGVFDLLLDNGADIHFVDDAVEDTALHYAIYFANADIAVSLIEKGADLYRANALGATPLLHLLIDAAPMRCRKGEVAALYDACAENGFDVNYRFSSAETMLHLESLHPVPLASAVRSLLRNGASVDALDGRGLTPIQIANHPGVFEALIEHGADLDVKDASGRTLLHRLHGKHADDIAGLLLVRAADADARDADGNSPLHGFSDGRYELNSAAIETLLKHGADVNARNTRGETPLHRAARGYNAEAAAALLARGAHVNARDARGDTPLLTAASLRKEGANKTMLVETLLKYGADVNAKNRLGNAPLCKAKYGYKSDDCLPDDWLFGCEEAYGVSPIPEMLIRAGARAKGLGFGCPDVEEKAMLLKNIRGR